MTSSPTLREYFTVCETMGFSWKEDTVANQIGPDPGDKDLKESSIYEIYDINGSLKISIFPGPIDRILTTDEVRCYDNRLEITSPFHSK